jgi:uncharacterized protein (TIGR03083 family)
MTSDEASTSDKHRLQQLVEVWHQSSQDTIALLRTIEGDEWARPTDLPGWDVRAIAAHLAHLESQLAGNPQAEVEVPPAPHVKGLLGEYTEGGVIARASLSTDELIDELEAAVEKRYADLTGNPPTDASALGPGFAGLMGWSWKTLLTNRPIDLWMHDQDIRRALGRPGDLDRPGAVHAAVVYGKSLPFVLGKKVGAAPGTTVVLEVTGAQPQVLAAQVGDDGRGATLHQLPENPDARLVMDFETWILLAGGRRTPADVQVEVYGDRDLAQQVLDNLGVTL